VLVVGVLGAVGFAGYRTVGSPPTTASGASPVVPTAAVIRGSLPLTVYLTGELRATKQIMLTAPPVGGTLRILTMTGTGIAVKKDDPVMEFDPADQQYLLEQAESELLEAEQEIIKRRAEILAQEAGDKVAVLTAQYDVRRAGLDAMLDKDLISANEFQIRQAELQEAKRNLAKLEQDVAGRSVTSKASLAVLQERKTRAEINATRARTNMSNLILRAPMDGVVSVRENMDAAGGFFGEGMAVPLHRPGDTVYSGRPVVDVFDVSALEVRARVNEQERAIVSVGQTATIESDVLTSIRPTAKVSSISGLGRPDSRWGPLRQFDVTLELRDPDPRLRPGSTVRLLIEGETVKNVLLLPRQALFEIDGKPNVYLKSGGDDSFSPRPIKVLHRTESQIAIEGLEEGAEVALVDPVAALKLSGTRTPAGSNPMDVKK
jgi:multidrug efflux pump subunit AcrA (membrane-fusion protein)